jgi:hypothetical protein
MHTDVRYAAPADVPRWDLGIPINERGDLRGSGDLHATELRRRPEAATGLEWAGGPVQPGDLIPQISSPRTAARGLLSAWNTALKSWG